MTDSQAFCGRFMPYSRRLFGVAVRLLRSAEEAEDVVQDVYMKLWQRYTQAGGDEMLQEATGDEALLVTMTRNLCIDHLRRRQELPEPVIETALDAGEELERREELSETLRLMELLPPDQQRVLRLRTIDELDFAQIEKITGFSAVNVRVLLSRGRKRLRELASRMTR